MFENIDTLMVLVPALPLAAALLTAVFGKALGERAHLPAAICTVLSFVCSLGLLCHVVEMAEQAEPAAAESAAAAEPVGVEALHTIWTWVSVDDAYDGAAMSNPATEGTAAEAPSRNFRIDVTLRADPLTSIMLSMVTFISSLIVIYASGYMHGERGYWRFFTYVSLFVFSMTMLVSVSNFVLLYVFWEAVGVCSYLLIGFWYHKPEAAAAGKKAFLVNRIGDVGFALGIFLLWTTYGTLNFHDITGADGTVLAGILGQTRLAQPAMFVGGGVGLAIALLLFVGACGKSAQFPLHVWLPDAMEGPTPVSALIHAATMVTAGVYLVARCAPLFFVAPASLVVVACIGGFTALLAGLIALTQNDLKRVLAYSTVSQLGYMFLGLGTGTLLGMTAGMFHLFTHAFFKALLFLGAGSVMHAMGGVIDMRRFGGLRHVLPWTYRTFWFGALALAGIFPFAGFFSKDAIVAAVHEVYAGHGEGSNPLADYATIFQVLYYAALFTALLTAFYTFRAMFMTFFGPERVPAEAGDHAHESPPRMTVPLMVLALGALTVGAYFEWTHGFAHLLAATPSLAFRPIAETTAPGGIHLDIAVISTIVALAGVGLAAFLYLGERREAEWLTGLMRRIGVYQLSYGKFFFDQIYNVLLVWPLRLLASASYAFDRWIIDGLVNLCGRVPVVFGSLMRSLQTGLVQFYALAMVLGLLVLIGTLLWWPLGS